MLYYCLFQTQVVTDKNQSILHLACLSHWIKSLDIEDKFNRALSVEDEDNVVLSLEELDHRRASEQDELDKRYFSLYKYLLDIFSRQSRMPGLVIDPRPRLLEDEDLIPNSPGRILHYFACVNYAEGATTLLSNPFNFDPNVLNKCNLSALFVAAHYKSNKTVRAILSHPDVDVNTCDPNKKVSSWFIWVWSSINFSSPLRNMFFTKL